MIDCSLTLAGVLAAIYLRLSSNVSYFLAGEYLVFRVMFVVFLIQMGFYCFDLHDPNIYRKGKEMFIRLLESLGVSSVLIAFMYYLVPSLVIGRGIFAISLILIFIFSFFWRLLYARVFKLRAFRERVLIIGTGPLAKKIEEEITSNGYDSFEIVGFIGENGDEIGRRM